MPSVGDGNAKRRQRRPELPRRVSRQLELRQVGAENAWRSWSSIACACPQLHAAQRRWTIDRPLALLVLLAFTMDAQRRSVEDDEALRLDQAPLRFL